MEVIATKGFFAFFVSIISIFSPPKSPKPNSKRKCIFLANISGGGGGGGGQKTHLAEMRKKRGESKNFLFMFAGNQKLV